MIIAIDIGSKNLSITKLSNKSKILKQVVLATPVKADDCIKIIKATILAEFGNKFDQIVVAIPGVVKNNIVSWCSNLGDDWINLDIAKQLKQQFDVTILVENDANLAGIFETRVLKPIPKNAIYLNIGAGIGSSFVINGQLVPELLHSEAGMTMLEYDGIVRKWEDFSSGAAISEAYNCLAKDIKKPAMWDAISDRFSRGLLMLIPIVQPDTIIIGGVMGNYFNRYQKHLFDLLDERLPEQIVRPKIVAATEPDLGVTYGCLAYSKDRQTEKTSIN